MTENDAYTPEQDPEAEATESGLDAELDAFTSQAVAGVDPNAYITIRTSGGDSRYVPVPEENGTMTAGEALMASNLSVSGSFQIFMDGVKIAFDTVVPAGKELTVLGNVKGG